jgi:hypothetical protein
MYRKWAWHVVRMEQKMNAHRFLVGKPGGQKALKRPRRRRESNIKIDLGETGRRHGLHSSASG